MKHFAISGLLVLASLCEAQSGVGADRKRELDERAVQAAAIDTVVAMSRIKVVLLMQSTAALSFSRERPAELPASAWADFVRKASVGRVIGTLAPRSPFEITTQSHASRPMRAPVTDTSVVTLSAVGFSPDGNDAIIYIDQSCGSRCGFTALEAFRCEGNRWILRARVVESMR